MKRIRVTVDEVAANPTDAYEVRVHGDVAIKRLSLHGGETKYNAGTRWVHVEYANGGTSTGCPAHWASYVRKINNDSEA